MTLRLVCRRPSAQTKRIASLAFVAVRIVDEIQHDVSVCLTLGCAVPPAEFCVRCQRVILVQIPHLLGVGQASGVRHKAGEKAVNIVDVAQ